MADIGVLPTRTSVNITSTTGENGTIPAATPRAAGVMTADHADQLATLWGEHQVKGGGTVVIERPAPRIDAVTRDELRAVVTGLQRSMAQTIVPQPLPASEGYEARLAELERREMDTALRVQQVIEAFERFCAIVETVQQQHEQRLCDLQGATRFIEDNAVAKVQVRAS